MDIKDLTLEEAKEKLVEISLEIKRIDYKKTQLNSTLIELRKERDSIKEKKKKRLQSIQDGINKEKSKPRKQSKREQKKREATCFDSSIEQLKSKIDKQRNEISKLNEYKAKFNLLKTAIKQHIKQLK